MPFVDDVLRSERRRGAIGRDHLADDQPVEQMPDRGKPLLHRGRGRSLRLRLELGGDVQRWLYLAERGYSVFLAPAPEQFDSMAVGYAGIADVGGEELQKAARGLFATGSDEGR